MPSEYTIHYDTHGTTLSIDADLDNIHVVELPKIEFADFNIHVKEVPKIEFADFNIRVKEVPTLTLNSNVAVTQLPEINSNVSIKELPEIRTSSKLDVAITEIPETRVHLPANYSIGLSVLGVCLVNLSLCGEAQVITEKYVPRRMEIC